MYKIGEVAKILGISPELMRYYEEKGVVTPLKDKKSDYRYYEAWDVNFLIECLWFKNFDFSIKDISQILSEYSYDKLENVLVSKTAELMEEIAHKQMILDRLCEQTERLASAKNNVGKCDIRTSPEIVRFLHRFNFIYKNSPEIQSLSKEWLNYFPFSRRCFEIGAYDLCAGGTDLAWGYSLDIHYVDKLGIAVKPPLAHLKPQKSIYSVVRQPGKYQFSARSLDYMIDYAAQNSIKLCGEAQGHLLCSVCEDGEMTGYFEVWLPIEE